MKWMYNYKVWSLHKVWAWWRIWAIRASHYEKKVKISDNDRWQYYLDGTTGPSNLGVYPTASQILLRKRERNYRKLLFNVVYAIFDFTLENLTKQKIIPFVRRTNTEFNIDDKIPRYIIHRVRIQRIPDSENQD